MDGLKWWQRAVFYQIYPRSFADSDGDGIGDFAGMAARLDHLRDLGVGAVWLSPHFPSPFLDCGYDISDYIAVAPEYGTLDDFRTFLREAHAREIRVILDLVLNHTSDQHAWFQASRSSRDNPRRDWFIWRDPAPGGGPPNNWASIFGGSAWEYDAASGQYYYHAFLKEQPDLNWRNPAVKGAMWEAVRFWLDMGVDGFRLDALATIYEHPGLPDHSFPRRPEEILDANPLSKEEYDTLMRHQTHQPGLHELMKELRALVDSYPGDRVLVGEEDDIAYHGSGDDELHLVFNFPLMRAPRLTPAHVRANQVERLGALPPGAWPCNTLGNHDTPRVWSRYGDGEHDDALARVNLALILAIKGTPFLYNGEEIGMANLILDNLGQLRDTIAVKQYHTMTGQLGVDPVEALRSVVNSTRDRCRSPMQWGPGPNADFSPAEVAPWLPVHPNHAAGVSVAAQAGDPGSLLSFYRRLIQLRQATPALVAGEQTLLAPGDEHVLAILRGDAATGQTVLVTLNFSAEARTVSLDPGGRRGRVLLSTHRPQGAAVEPGTLALEPFEVLLIDIK